MHAVEWVPIALAIIAGLAGGAGYIKGATSKARVEALRGDIEDKDRRLNELRVDLTAAEANLREETLRREALEKVVTGEKQLEEIAAILHIHDDRAKDIQETVNATFDLLEEKLR